MPESEYFQSNVERWSLIYPKDAERVSLTKCQRVSLCKTGQGQLNLQKEVEGCVHYYHSEENPLEEAKQWFSTLETRQLDNLFVFGVGLGYYYEAAKEWLQDPSHHLIFLENDLEVIHRLFETKIGSHILHDRQVRLQYFDREEVSNFDVSNLTEGVWQSLSTLYVEGEFKISALAYYANTFPDLFQIISTTLSFWFMLSSTLFAEYDSFGEHFFSNFYRNILLLPNSYRANELFGKFSGIPAIICGAGPSLDKNLPLLEKLGDKALIFAGGTAMNAVNSRGFQPHFGLGIDPNKAQMSRLIMNTAYEVPFLYRGRVYSEALEFCQGNKLYITGTGGYDISEWFEKECGIQGQNVAEGANVVNLSLSIAHALGCNPIIFVGLDLAYTDRQSYQSGVLCHPTHIRKVDFKTKGKHDEILVKNDIYGAPVYTLWKWVTESMWYSEYARRNPEVTYINATEGGIGMAGIPNVSLEEAVQRFCKLQLELRLWTHGEIQNSTMPLTVTDQKISGLLETLAKSLENCQVYCQALLEDSLNISTSLDRGENASDTLMSEAGENNLKKLSEEIAYIYLLHHFQEHFIRKTSLELQKIVLDESLSPEAMKSKKARLQAETYRFLRDTAIVNMTIIRFCREQKGKWSWHEAVEKPSPSLELAPEEHYSFENQILTLIDPSLNLSYRESQPSNVTTSHFYYEDGSVKIEQYYLDGLLHGPVSFFSPTGNLLGKCWYVKGVKQGKAWQYYDHKKIYSLQRYVNGQLEGLQEYYYRNGTQKTTLNYHKDLLDGANFLYYPNGDLKRELHFVQGKRDGIEKMWDQNGNLIIEVEYDQDRPTGKAKTWYSSGRLAEEITYDAAFRPSLIRRWNENGIEEFQQSDDYFDLVTRQTGLLTKSLDTVYESLKQLEPQEIATPEIPSTFQDDLAELRDQFEYLHKMNTELLSESGLEGDNINELIWKTPASENIIKNQLEEITKKMSQDISQIQNMIIKTVEELDKQNKEGSE